MIKTRLTEMFGIQSPIVMGGMTGVGYADLVASVANAGALGFLTAHMFQSGEELQKEIQRVRDQTDQPFGVNMTILPSINPIPYDEYRQAICESGVKLSRLLAVPKFITAPPTSLDWLPLKMAFSMMVSLPGQLASPAPRNALLP